MTTFPAFASAFEIYPKEGEAFEHLSSLLGKLTRVHFALCVNDPAVNRGQMGSDFDEALKKALLDAGAQPFDLNLPSEILQEFDFAFAYDGCKVAVEIEKTNREKILRDVLKCHMYLHSGADFAIVGLPKNYAHTHGVWNLFDFGVERFRECQTYGFGTPDKFGRILLLGFDQYDAVSNQLLGKATRQEMRARANTQQAHSDGAYSMHDQP